MVHETAALFFVRRFFDHEGPKHTKTHEELVTTRFSPIGVRDVRNHLIQHPRALHWDFQLPRIAEGVVMKPFRDATDASHEA